MWLDELTDEQAELLHTAFDEFKDEQNGGRKKKDRKKRDANKQTLDDNLN